MKYSFEGVAADGKPIAYGFSVKFDGKDNPISGSMPSGADTISAKRTDSHHYRGHSEKGRQSSRHRQSSGFENGKVTTVDSTGTDAAGKTEHEVQVYDKQ